MSRSTTAMRQAKTPALDCETSHAGKAFLRRISGQYAIVDAFVFGSRARGDHEVGSDADIAVILQGTPGNRWAAAAHMAGIAFDIMQDTSILVDPLPIWESEYRAPDTFSNPALIQIIQREGLPL